MKLKFLLEKEFRQIFRNPTILRMIIAMPTILLLVLPWAADYEIRNINIAVVDHDHSTATQKMVNSIVSSGYFRLVFYGNAYSDAFRQIEKDKADLVLEIPAGFERNLVREGSQKVLIAVNAINGTKANVGGAYLVRILADYNRQLITEIIPLSSFSAQPLIEVVPVNRFNPMLNYKYYMVPGILVILVTIVGMTMCSMNIVAEKEKGTIEQINVTPIKKYQFILGKLIPFWILGVIVFSLGLLVIARFVYGIIPAGNVLVLYAFLAIYLITVLGIGLTISAYSSTQQQAMSVAFFLMMIFLLMNGLFTPIESMPVWAQWIAHINPVTYFVDATRMVVLKGSGFHELKKHFFLISIFAIIFNAWAVISYRKIS